MRKTFVRTPYNYDVEDASRRSGLACRDVSRTQQQFKTEADINHIVKLFGVTGRMPEASVAPVYEDFTDVGDYHSALNTVRAAAAAFMDLPSAVRKRFGNDPQQLVDFCSDPANADELAKLGLTQPLVVPTGAPAVSVSPAVVAAPPGAVASSS